MKQDCIEVYVKSGNTLVTRYQPRVYVDYIKAMVAIANAPLFKTPADAIKYAQNWYTD